MSAAGLVLGDFTSLVTGFRATEFTFVACTALWTYEYFLTLDREITLVWRSRWSYGKVLFFFNRYSPIIDLVLVNYIFQGVKNQATCLPLVSVTLWFFTIGFLWSEIILAMRTWAIWEGNRFMLIFLIVLTLAVTVSELVLTHKLTESVTNIRIPEFFVPMLGLTCAPLPKQQGEFWPDFLVFMINQAIVAILALFRAFRQYRLTKNPLIRTIFHDGIFYYIYTLVLSIANVLVTLLAPVQWSIFVAIPLRVLTSIFCTRFLLNIRGAYFQQSTVKTDNNRDRSMRPTNFNFQQRQAMSHSEAPDPTRIDIEMAELSTRSTLSS